MADSAKTANSSAPGYDDDFCLWAKWQAALLRAGAFKALDVDNLVREVESMLKSERRAAEADLVVIFKTLLKYEFQPDERTGDWRSMIREHRRRLGGYLEDSPSLVEKLAANYDACYRSARLQAADETGLPPSTFPEEPHLDLSQALDDAFWPGSEPEGSTDG